MNFVELFAGCGGLSLGLKSIGFELMMANELSPMAAETYAFNFLREDIESLSRESDPKLSKTLWLASNHPRADLSRRRREDPRTYPSYNNAHSDLRPDGSNFRGSLVVGSITELNRWLADHEHVATQLRSGFGQGELDLVSGGPPCQSFSMAGLRRQDCEKNTLPWEFAKFASATKPKFVLLENVTGILKPFKDNTGAKYYAWFELAKVFAEVGYYPLCLHVNAKYVGVAQNRQRFLLLGVREDVFARLSEQFSESEHLVFRKAADFYALVRKGRPVELRDLDCWDVENESHFKLFQQSFLSPLVASKVGAQLVSAKSAIGDMRRLALYGYAAGKRNDYAKALDEAFAPVLADSMILHNHDLRTNTDLVKRRFRLYQVLSQTDALTRSNVLQVVRGDSLDLNDEDWATLRDFRFLKESGTEARFRGRDELIEFLRRHATKKRTQRALHPGLPAPATVSIPDDACHYEELRTLTVREMARLQSFPDRFVFRSKITTGGHLRRFEVPQYTQVGNAVPPLLGRALGEVIKSLLARLSTSCAARELAEAFELTA